MALEQRKDVPNIDSYIGHMRSLPHLLIPVKIPLTVWTNYQIQSELAMLGYDYLYFEYGGFLELYALRLSLATQDYPTTVTWLISFHSSIPLCFLTMTETMSTLHYVTLLLYHILFTTPIGGHDLVVSTTCDAYRHFISDHMCPRLKMYNHLPLSPLHRFQTKPSATRL